VVLLGVLVVANAYLVLYVVLLAVFAMSRSVGALPVGIQKAWLYFAYALCCPGECSLPDLSCLSWESPRRTWRMLTGLRSLGPSLSA